MMRAVISTHKGDVTPVFRPYHADFFVSDREEFSLESVMHHISGLSGTRSMVTDRKPEVKKDVHVRKMLGGLQQKDEALGYVDEDALKQAVASVRDNADETTWCVAGFTMDGKTPLMEVKSTGNGDTEEFAQALCNGNDNLTSYGIIRFNQTIDMSTTVKFLLVTYVPEDIEIKYKSLLGTKVSR